MQDLPVNHVEKEEVKSLFDQIRREWKEFFSSSGFHFKYFLKWLLAALMIGAVVGAAGIFFYRTLVFVTDLRTKHWWLVCFLPFAGLLMVWLYRVAGEYHNKGTNLVLRAIQSEEHISIKVAPLIFLATALTHLCGGSAGREGAALQLGGSLGNYFAQLFHLDENDKKIAIMCAMSACFSAVFGTPMAAAFFSMEVISVGIMHYSALVPCVVASLTASMLAKSVGIAPEQYAVLEIPPFTWMNAGKLVILALCLALVSILFCLVLHQTEHLYQSLLSNPYLRVFVGGCLVIFCTLIFQTTDYLNAGLPMIERCFEEGVPWYAFLLKILFTALTLGAGYKGGEIVPSFFVGATLGFCLGTLLGLPTGLCAACGMVGVFCGVTNSPVTSILIAFELFGFEGMPYYLLTVAVCYMLSGYYGLYNSQKIVYSKYKTRYINANTNSAN